MSERFPKEVPIARVSKKGHLAHVVIKAKDVTGAMASISAILASEGVDVRQSAAFAVDREGYYVYNAFVWLTKKGYPLEELVAKLKASQFVIEVQAREGVEGSVVDTLAFPLQFEGTRAVMLETRALVSMFEALGSVLGTGGAVLLREQGYNYGKSQSADMAKTLTRPYMVRNYRYGLMMLMATGWGVPKVLEASEDLAHATVRVDECFECVGREQAKESGYFMSGYLAGIFSFLSGKELQGKETKCVAAGDDHCEIEVSHP
ncbi:MAG: hypothetical protein JRN08_03575 [Nitrososphaerota archaeon]|nr:hypothetical protein [Nitrososphaerota archaeon]